MTVIPPRRYFIHRNRGLRRRALVAGAVADAAAAQEVRWQGWQAQRALAGGGVARRRALWRRIVKDAKAQVPRRARLWALWRARIRIMAVRQAGR
jgi:hypothetical protein